MLSVLQIFNSVWLINYCLKPDVRGVTNHPSLSCFRTESLAFLLTLQYHSNRNRVSPYRLPIFQTFLSIGYKPSISKTYSVVYTSKLLPIFQFQFSHHLSLTWVTFVHTSKTGSGLILSHFSLLYVLNRCCCCYFSDNISFQSTHFLLSVFLLPSVALGLKGLVLLWDIHKFV